MLASTAHGGSGRNREGGSGRSGSVGNGAGEASVKRRKRSTEVQRELEIRGSAGGAAVEGGTPILNPTPTPTLVTASVAAPSSAAATSPSYNLSEAETIASNPHTSLLCWMSAPRYSLRDLSEAGLHFPWGHNEVRMPKCSSGDQPFLQRHQ